MRCREKAEHILPTASDRDRDLYGFNNSSDLTDTFTIQYWIIWQTIKVVAATADFRDIPQQMNLNCIFYNSTDAPQAPTSSEVLPFSKHTSETVTILATPAAFQFAGLLPNFTQSTRHLFPQNFLRPVPPSSFWTQFQSCLLLRVRSDTPFIHLTMQYNLGNLQKLLLLNRTETYSWKSYIDQSRLQADLQDTTASPGFKFFRTNTGFEPHIWGVKPTSPAPRFTGLIPSWP